MRTSIFNNSLSDREKLYFSILRTVKEFKTETIGSMQSNRLDATNEI